jgi:hypothetical protein
MAYHQQPSGSDAVANGLIRGWIRGWRRERLVYWGMAGAIITFALFVEALATFAG